MTEYNYSTGICMKISVHIIFHVIRYSTCMKQYPNSTITSSQNKLFFLMQSVNNFITSLLSL
jgi:hypothetical protein